VQVLPAILLLLDAYGPQALDALGLVRSRSVVVALVRVGLGHPESEEGHGKELEGVLERGAVRDRRQ
jgi:hypothetical protein